MTRFNLNPKVPTIPNFTDKTQIDVRYMLIPPYANAHVYWDESRGELVYDLEEPVLNDQEKEILKQILISIQDMINISLVVENQGLNQEDYLDKIIKLIISELGLKVSVEGYNKVFYYVYRNFIGLNQIEAIMHDYFIEDIECNGAGEPLYLVHRVFRNMRTNIIFDTVEELASFVEKMAQKSGRYVSYANPLLDGTLPDGSRVNATYTKDITSKGPTFTIRKFTKTPWTPIQLIGFGTVSPEMLAYFWLMMEHHMNVLIAGGTASGKTTLLNAIAFFIPPEARVVSIEDTRELNLPRENWLPSVARTGVTAAGAGNVDMFSLLKASFRQNPDYVIVGEVRGQEASVLFQGMASGHSSMGTIHADSVETVIRRLETPPISLNPTLVNELDVVAVMTHAIVGGRDTRKLREIIEVINVMPDGTAETNTPFMWDPSQDRFFFKKGSKVFEKIERRSGVSAQSLEAEFNKRTRLIYTLFQKKIVNFEELKRMVTDYYANPQKVLAKYGIV